MAEKMTDERIREIAAKYAAGIPHNGLVTMCMEQAIRAALSESAQPMAEKMTAFAIINDQGYWCGIWRDRETAELVLSKGQKSHGERIVALSESAQEEKAAEARCAELREALRKLTLMARTSGGTAGPDAGLMAACEQSEAALAKEAKHE